jgi:hypothetical protein
MDIAVIIILVLVIIGVTFVSVSFLKTEFECDQPKVIYKYIPQNTLDVQFGEGNKPSEILNDMFVKSSPWIGGYDIGSGKTYIVEKNDKKEE